MKKPILLAASALLVSGLLAWTSLRPSNHRNWSSGQERLPEIARRGDSITISNLRNFDYDSAGDPVSVRYETRHYDLRELETVWFVLAPFEPENRGPAHSFLSFGFSDSQYVAVSVEARRELDEPYSIVRGLLKRFELMYVIGDERDLVRLRVARGDDVYLYPIKASPEQVRALFNEVVTRADALRKRPEFYNTLTNNCTTNILKHANRVASRKIPYGREVLLPGYADQLAKKLGLLDSELSIEQARQRFHINERARQAFSDRAFSVRIRTPES